MRLLVSFPISALLIALVAAGNVASSEKDGLTAGSAVSARDKFILPKLFDFSQFKALFQKSYSSLVEEIARKKLFLGRAFQAVISAVKYKYNTSNYHLSVNDMSDQSPDELRKRRISADKIRKKNFAPETPVVHDEDPLDIEEIPVADIDDIETVINEINTMKDQPGYKEIAEEFQEVREHARDKRSATSRGVTRQISINDLLPKKRANSNDWSKVAETVPSNNPSYVPIEMPSYGSEMEIEDKSSLSSSLIDMINQVPGSQILSTMVKKASAALSSPVVPTTNVYPTVDVKFIDHRESGCFGEARYQRKCGACYAFTTIAYSEWLYCRQTGKRVEFSEQYLVDCGHLSRMEGCEGGPEDGAAEFVHACGLHLRSEYPYLGKEDTCPIEGDDDLESTGYIRLMTTGYKYVKLDKIDKILRKRPIMIGLKVSDDFDFYGGGIHDNVPCPEENGHLMLLVGSGIQDGIDYYLFRNSYGSKWGEEGYYKVSQQSVQDCSCDGYGGYSTGNFVHKQSKNLLFDHKTIQDKKKNALEQ